MTGLTTLVRLAKIAVEGPDLQEVDVGDRLLTVAVPRTRVIRHEITWFEVELFEEEGVRSHELAPPGATVIQGVDGFPAAVHRVDQLEPPDAVVVLGPHLGGDFLEASHLDVATRLGHPENRWLVGERIDQVVGRGLHPVALSTVEEDAVAAGLTDRDGSAQPSAGVELEGNGIPLVQQNRATGHGDRRQYVDGDPGAH